MTQDERADSPATRHLDHEMAEVEAAVAMVWNGAAASVSLAGLSHGEALVEATRAEAASFGIVIEPIWGWEEDHCDLVVRRATAADRDRAGDRGTSAGNPMPADADADEHADSLAADSLAAADRSSNAGGPHA